jgi:hypothetical protein
MRSHPASYRLSFLLPKGVSADPGRHRPSPDGCILTVAGPMAEILGPSREATFEHATRFLRVVCRGRPPLSIAAVLETPVQPAGRDSWSIIVGADVSFSPTALDPHFPREQKATPPPLALVGGGRGA